MASHSLPIPVPQARVRSEAHTSSRLPSVQVTIAVFAALLILFGWLHLLLAMQIASTDRQILSKNEELRMQKRDNAAVLRHIAEAESPRNMEDRIELEDYQVGGRVYLYLPELAEEDAPGSDRSEAAPLIDTEHQAQATPVPSSLIESVFGELYGSQTRVGP
jgi:hypothetical protein